MNLTIDEVLEAAKTAPTVFQGPYQVVESQQDGSVEVYWGETLPVYAGDLILVDEHGPMDVVTPERFASKYVADLSGV